jgi:prophage regulatory protein
MQSSTPPPSFPESGLVRLAAILAPKGPVPVSRSTWWAKVKSGEFPQPVKLGPRITCWQAEDIRQLIRRNNETTR